MVHSPRPLDNGSDMVSIELLVVVTEFTLNRCPSDRPDR